ncbi:hypothetical protein Q5752_003590 [Cryptotrichosporon argae]
MTATTAPIAGPSVTSPSLLTPRQGAMSLQPQLAALAEAVPSTSRPASALGPRGTPGDALADERAGGRSPSPALTVSNGPDSPPSNSESLPPSASAAPSPDPTSGSSSSGHPAPPLLSTTADVGLGTLQGEDELKNALAGRDRLWLLVLANEIEKFVERVHAGEAVPEHDVALPTSLLAETFGPSKVLNSTPTSKYQRMLVYKAAEWYGLRAVSGTEAVMLLGVLGSLDGKAATLRLANLVKRESTLPAQQFQIMRRAPAASGAGSSRATSVSGDDGETSSGSRMQKTLEERELAYAQARKRIIGDDELPTGDRLPANQSRPPLDDADPVPRHAYGADFEVVYPTLRNDGQTTPGPVPAQVVPFAYQQAAPYQHPQPAPYPPYPAYATQAMPYLPSDPNRPVYMPIDPYAGGAPYSGQPPYYVGWQGAVPTHNAGGWVYPHVQPQPGMMVPAAQGMPMIPQGIQYPAPYPPAQYAPMPPHQPSHLAQPTPLRPGMQPHSSASSSMSSRSYQDGASRPHSRGSTTSTRSAASSVRLGVMYPTGQQHYRQRPMLGGQGGGFSSMTSLSSDQRRGRGQSPSQASTTSSVSSRQAPLIQSINIQQPHAGQHPLPQRPDWAANNIPYHPSPIANAEQPSQTDFPPLARNGTNAEPMQVEKAKVRNASGGSVWTGSSAKAFQPGQPTQIAPNPRRTPGPPQQHGSQQQTPQAQYSSHPQQAEQHADDPDFPRRMPPSRAPALYDPLAPRSAPASTPIRPPVAPAASAPVGRAITPGASAPASTSDDIEARLAAVSVSAGVSIGPPVRQPPSYAKIVRRD